MEKRLYSKEKVKTALGALLTLFSLFLFLAPGTSFAVLIFPIFYLFGLAGIWIFLPALFATGLVLFFCRHFPKKYYRYNALFGYLFLLLGVSILFGSTLCYKEPVSYWEYSDFLLSFLGEGVGPMMYVDVGAGGGILGYAFVSLLSGGGTALTLFIGALLSFLGIAFFSLPYFLLLHEKYSSRLRFQNVHSVHKEEEVKEDYEKDTPKLVLKSEEELSPSLSRSELYMDLPKVDAPEEVRGSLPTPRAMDEGLRPVYFENKKEETTASSFVKEETVPPLSKEEKTVQKKIEEVPPLQFAPEKEEKKEEIIVEEKPTLEEVPPLPTFAKAETITEKKEEDISPSIISTKEETSLSLPPLPSLEEKAKEATFMEEKKEEASPKQVEVDLGPALSPEEIALFKLGQPRRKEREPYEFPSLDLLKDYGERENDEEIRAECEERKAAINQAFIDLGVGASIASYTIGPSVTRYDIQTDKNVSVSSIARYVKDLSVRLGGVQTRYEEVVLGSPYSALEIANTETTTVGLKEMLTHMKSVEKMPLAVPFGKSIAGDYYNGDLGDFPHMLVSGTSGSGKSVFMHGLIMSLIMRNRPEDLKLVIIDPKKVELSKYRELPHLLCPIISEPKIAKACLDKLVDEMERRYDLMALADASNIKEFNRDYAPEHGVEPIPAIVCFIDEYADLADSVKTIGEPLLRIAQKARAAGIHLVVATQRPSVNVITGTIKANLLVRVALAVSSATDSMTILDQGGAENLVGNGDMLVSCTQLSRTGLVRAQGAFVSGREIKEVCDAIRAQRGPDYDPKFLHLEEEEESVIAPSPSPAIKVDHNALKAATDNEFYEEVKQAVMILDYCSVSWLRRTYGIGFPKAGGIFDRLKKEGIVASGPSSTSAKGSKVLIHSNEELEEKKLLEEGNVNEGGD